MAPTPPAPAPAPTTGSKWLNIVKDAGVTLTVILAADLAAEAAANSMKLPAGVLVVLTGIATVATAAISALSNFTNLFGKKGA